MRAVAEFAIAGGEADIGLSVDAGLPRRGVGTYLAQTVARLLALRGVTRMYAYTRPDNAGFLALARRLRRRGRDRPRRGRGHLRRRTGAISGLCFRETAPS